MWTHFIIFVALKENNMNYKEKYDAAVEAMQKIMDSRADLVRMSKLKKRLQAIFPELKNSTAQDKDSEHGAGADEELTAEKTQHYTN